MIKPTISSFWIMLHFTRKDYLQTVKNGIKNQKVSRTDSQRSALSQGLLYDDSGISHRLLVSDGTQKYYVNRSLHTNYRL